MDTVMIGFDGSEASRDALALGAAIAPSDARLIVASVRIDLGFTVIEEGEERPWADELRRGAGEVLGDREFEFDAAVDSSAARALHVMAHQARADLLVLGSSSRGSLGAVIPGRTAERLLHAGPCAIAVSPRGFAESDNGEMERIGVAVDGGSESQRATEEAAAMASRLGAELVVISVVPPIIPADPKSGNPRPLIEAAREDASRWVAEAIDLVPEGVRVIGEILDGDPVESLIELSARLDALFMGSRGYGPIGHVLLGAVSSRVIRSAGCPVIVVSRHADTEQMKVRRAAQRATA